jgi:hypothetical protein
LELPINSICSAKKKRKERAIVLNLFQKLDIMVGASWRIKHNAHVFFHHEIFCKPNYLAKITACLLLLNPGTVVKLLNQREVQIYQESELSLVHLWDLKSFQLLHT